MSRANYQNGEFVVGLSAAEVAFIRERAACAYKDTGVLIRRGDDVLIPRQKMVAALLEKLTPLAFEWQTPPASVPLVNDDEFINVGDNPEGFDWVCNCGNQAHVDGFWPCDRTGAEIEPLVGVWEELSVCGRCGLILTNQGRIVGKRGIFAAQPA